MSQKIQSRLANPICLLYLQTTRYFFMASRWWRWPATAATSSVTAARPGAACARWTSGWRAVRARYFSEASAIGRRVKSQLARTRAGEGEARPQWQEVQ